MFKDFFKGWSYIIRGCREFYGDAAAWKYALLPVGVMLLAYCLIFWGVMYLAGFGGDFVSRLMADLPQWLSWLGSCASAVAYLFGAIVALLFLGMTVCTFYELFGGFFFDSLVEYHEHKKYGHCVKKRPFSTEVRYAIDSVRFGILTFVYFILFFMVSLFFTVVGQILLIGFTGYYMALSYMVCSANNMECTVNELRRAAVEKKWMVLGFGVGAYVMMLIPFALLFLLPGFVLGGSELFHDEIRERLEALKKKELMPDEPVD